jgi:hypothetical protein
MKHEAKVGSMRGLRNLVPLPYRCVSMQAYDGEMTAAAIVSHLMGREAYRRTDFIILHNDTGGDKAYAVAAIKRAFDESDPLFTSITRVEVLALPETCVFIEDKEVDPANRSGLGALARRHGIGPGQTLILWGMYDHVNLIHNPDPLVIRVIEVAPPEPPKLFSLARKVLVYADLPPIELELERIELRKLCHSVEAKSYLVPCRSGGLDDLPAPVHFLDERPGKREDWVLIGCERSLQFHRHYYGDEPPMMDMCPRNLAGQRAAPTLLKCCLLETHFERDGPIGVVPWGTDLDLVEQALRKLSEDVDYA